MREPKEQISAGGCGCVCGCVGLGMRNQVAWASGWVETEQASCNTLMSLTGKSSSEAQNERTDACSLDR